MIQQSTGKDKSNKAVDVIVLQLLLNDIAIYKKAPSEGAKPETPASYTLDSTAGGKKLEKLKVDGKSITELVTRITAYQSAKSMAIVDGWVGPRGNTIKAILADAKVATNGSRMAYIRKKLVSPCGVSSLKVEVCLALYEKQYGSMAANNKDGLRYILTTASSDSDLTSLPEFAYMLATTKHETAHTFRGIEEYGKGASRPYGKEIKVVDPKTKKTYKNKYYGRGYVQLTWGYNYQRLDEKLGNGIYPNKNKTKAIDYNKGFTVSQPTKSIYLNPAKALDKENAYVGLVWAMQKGIYTSKKIGDYVNKTKIDYVNARRVINGTDKAAKIAGYAENFEIIMLTSTQ
ncbi:hypothetical protein [Agarilytica rhodophyticola]|uniref:hypothetical protein n=1 Tax=Agarilytica rhodophyticola TaxID=1737490 RepID=UPI000B3474EB|nr:hypothetical protein [Agarilytica rhodophyticola]